MGWRCPGQCLFDVCTDDTFVFALEGVILQSTKFNQYEVCHGKREGKLTYIIEVAVGSPFWAIPAFQGAWLRKEEHSSVLLPYGVMINSFLFFMEIEMKERPYFERSIQVAGDGWDNVTLGHSVVTWVREALATSAAALALIDLSSASPHCYSTSTLWGVQRVEKFENLGRRLSIYISQHLTVCVFAQN